MKVVWALQAGCPLRAVEVVALHRAQCLRKTSVCGRLHGFLICFEENQKQMIVLGVQTTFSYSPNCPFVQKTRGASGRPVNGWWAASGRPVGGQWAADGRPVGGWWAASGRPVGGRWSASGRPEGGWWAAGGRPAGGWWAAGGLPACFRDYDFLIWKLDFG